MNTRYEQNSKTFMQKYVYMPTYTRYILIN